MKDNQEFAPMWLYQTGKHLDTDLWEIDGIKFRIITSPAKVGVDFKIVPNGIFDHIKLFLRGLF